MNKNFIKIAILGSIILGSCNNNPVSSDLSNNYKKDNILNNSNFNSKENINNNINTFNSTNKNQDGNLNNKSADSNPISLVNNNLPQNSSSNTQIQQSPQPNPSSVVSINPDSGRIGVSINFNPPCKRNVDPNCN